MRKIDQILDQARKHSMFPLESRAYQEEASALIRQTFANPDLQAMVAFLAHAIVEGTLTLEDFDE